MSVAKVFSRWVLLAVLVGVLSDVGLGQMTDAGAIAGVVTAPDGTVVVGAAVTLTVMDAPARVVSTGGDGSFLVRGLASGSYAVRVTAASFAAKEESVSVAVGRTTQVAIQLEIAGTVQTVNVSAAPVTLDISQTSSVVNIDRDRVEELPIPSRNYLTFVILAPQVAPANPVLLQQPGMTQGGGSFSFGGLRPGSNAIYLDEGNDNDEYTGGSRTQLSPEAISDFQIVNHGFAAQSGGGAGGSIDVQSRVGVNKIHGDAFTFVQNGALNAIPPLGMYPSRPDDNRVRVGVALGGPIERNRMFYYVAGEQEMAHGEDVNDLSAGTIGAINSSLPGYAPLAGLTLESGFFPTTDQETEISGRVDRTLSAKESAMLRYAFTNNRNVNDAFYTDELTDRSARGSLFVADNSLNGTLTSMLTESVVNKVSFEVAQRRAEGRTWQTSGPGVLVAGMASFGTPFSGNDRRFETNVEFADTVALQMKQHFVQFGGRVDHVALRTSVPDGAQGFFVFGGLGELQSSTPDFYVQSFGNFNTNLSETRFAGFAQDHWSAAKGLTLDYGLRYEYNRLPSSFPQDAVNFSPRFGVAWSPLKDTVVRGGFGIFYDRFLLGTINRIAEFDGVHAFSQIVEDTDAASVYRTGVIPADPVAGIAPSVWRAQPGLRNPYSEVASLSVERALPWQTTLTGEYQFVHGVHLGRTTNVNLEPPVMLTLANASELGVSAPTPQQLGRLVFPKTRVNGALDAVNEFANSAGSSYNGGTVSVNRQFQDDVQVMAGYTFSKTMDDASYDTEQPENPYALGNERALSLMDQRHRFTLSGLWLIGPDLGDPADAARNANPGPLMKALTGLEFASIIGVGSGFRANPITGLESNREHVFPFAARPFGYGRNSLATPVNVDLDLRALKMIPLYGGHLDVVAESFNLLNHKNVNLVNGVFGSGSLAAGGFGGAVGASEGRKVQFSLDYEF